MYRTRLLKTAAALILTFPLGAGAVSDTKREPPDASSLAREGVRGTDLAIQVASGLAQGLRRDGGAQPRTEPNGPTPGAGFDHPAPAPERDNESPAPVPEPSSMLLFAASLLLARAALRRPGAPSV